MDNNKFYELKSITIGNRQICPIALLKVKIFKEIFIDISYEVSAIKIIENDETYFKNIGLSQNDFETIIENYK